MIYIKKLVELKLFLPPSAVLGFLVILRREATITRQSDQGLF